MSPGAEQVVSPRKRHLITLSFDDGWGPIRATYLDQLIKRLLARESVEVLPAGRALARYG